MTRPPSHAGAEAGVPLPCPFCAAAPAVHPMSGYLAISCDSCGACADRSAYLGFPAAVAAWNRRAAPAPDVGMREAIASLREWMAGLPIPTEGIVPQIRNVDAILSALIAKGQSDG